VATALQNALEFNYSILVLVAEASGILPEAPTAYNRPSPLLYLIPISKQFTTLSKALPSVSLGLLLLPTALSAL